MQVCNTFAYAFDGAGDIEPEDARVLLAEQVDFSIWELCKNTECVVGGLGLESSLLTVSSNQLGSAHTCQHRDVLNDIRCALTTATAAFLITTSPAFACGSGAEPTLRGLAFAATIHAASF